MPGEEDFLHIKDKSSILAYNQTHNIYLYLFLHLIDTKRKWIWISFMDTRYNRTLWAHFILALIIIWTALNLMNDPMWWNYASGPKYLKYYRFICVNVNSTFRQHSRDLLKYFWHSKKISFTLREASVPTLNIFAKKKLFASIDNQWNLWSSFLS